SSCAATPILRCAGGEPAAYYRERQSSRDQGSITFSRLLLRQAFEPVDPARIMHPSAVAVGRHHSLPHRNNRMPPMQNVRWLGVALAAVIPVGCTLDAAELNDYPTAARADYVFACMKTNGETRRALEQCSCSIDVIASILPYDHYVA